MLDSALEVRDALDLQHLLLLTVQHMKSLHATLGALMADVAAVRRTVLQDDDTVLHYKNNLLSTMETAKPLVDQAMQSYDVMIQQIEESGGMRN